MAAMLSHAGCVRSGNEDTVIYSVPAEGGPSAAYGVLLLVADGMGGHAAGEVASQIAARTIHHLFYRELKEVPDALAEGFSAANLAIRKHAGSNPACEGMGTTCTVIVLRDGCLWLGHIGDSRAYLLRNGRVWRISEDHSLVAELVRNGSLTEEEARTFPDRNVILRALGIEVTVQPMIWREGLPVKAGDIVVLCTDGLSDLVDDGAIRDVATAQPPFDACKVLIQTALDAGAPDNVSVGVMAITRDDGKPRVGRRTSQIDSSLARGDPA
jgi:protein phosphatase